jgi:uncharacterized membrane protein YkvA (DUF1232 family)
VSATEWVLAGAAVTLALYVAFVVVLVAAGRGAAARAVAGFVPDCLVLFRRLLGDARVPRGRKVVLWALLAYLAVPVDVVPDFIPVAGQLDDVVVVVLVLRLFLRRARDLVTELWPGPRSSLDVILRLTY